MLRIDPLTDSKAFDVNFFQEREEFETARAVVERYLKDEGFDNIDQGVEVIIQIADRWWSVRRSNQ